MVGGSVRDFLLGRESQDHDLATSADPETLCRLFPEALTVGKEFGVVKVPIDSGIVLEIATFRKDIDYGDYRHPKNIVLAGPEEDALRRDFTINALYFDPKTARILDQVDGLTDLKAGVIRAIGVPSDRFKEDALRLLRAVRFTTHLGFKLDPDTQKALSERARLITKVSGERMRDELTQMWMGPHPVQALVLLQETGLLSWVLPELEALHRASRDYWKHALRVVGNLAKNTDPSQRSLTLAWTVVLHDIGKAAILRKNDGKSTSGHEKETIRLIQVLASRLKFPRHETQVMCTLVENHVRFNDVFRMRDATLQRFIRQPYFEELLILHRADAMATGGNLAAYEFCSSLYEEFKRQGSQPPPKLIGGEDLIQLGFQPGPDFTRILETIEDLAMENQIQTKEQALEYVIKHFVS